MSDRRGNVRNLQRSAVLAVYLILAFVFTHLPPSRTPIPPLLSDKLLHFLGFAVLGVLVIWRLAGRRRAISLPMALLWYLAIVGYAAMDEATQPWVGRSCEFLDWAADIGGGGAGMAIATVCFRLPLRRESVGPPRNAE